MALAIIQPPWYIEIPMLNAGTLHHGGIMVNYQCTAACRHCLYASSPTRSPGYMDQAGAREVCGNLRRGGCSSVHIGGGEPFLNFEGLLTVIRELRRGGITLEYIETNAFWADDEAAALDKLRALRDEGADTLCISLDPFHAEYVPYGLPLRLAKLCDQAGMGYFLWKEQFLRSLSKLSPTESYGRPDLEKSLVRDYIHGAARAYGIRYGGRAVNIEGEYQGRQSAAALLDGTPCPNLLSTGHFHVDREGYFIPPGCTGIRLPLAEVVDGIPPGKYPAFDALYHQGPEALLALAKKSGFTEAPEGYPSKCALCFHLRRHLAAQGLSELDGGHYEESLKYYT